MKWRKEADEAEASVDQGDPVEPLAVDDLHGAVVDAVQPEVEEEYGQEIVWGSWSAREAKIQAEDDVYEPDYNQTNKSGLGFSSGLFRIFFFDEQILNLFRNNLRDNEQNFVIIFHHSNVVGVNRHHDDYNDVTLVIRDRELL